ncbi:MazG nucleotide pyrophosphohydrolase domain-containing protein [Cognatishimia activa]|uniref:Uncharacterized protein n=1 Tax=Cognatishimia activa TaxID=1715691 RepID=A0A0P1IX03_9RHOB|nr:MazG nucleotide pyrophosphohydrolase domain-containing protein [Cognatishimia activa]CUI69543.1 hypothetical protein TA5113_01177 [Cognatishimia activa]CUK26535.1 hypothetical protein TA5114_02350 [Cognatishimia activa]
MEKTERLDLRELQIMARRVSDIYAQNFDVNRDAAWYLGKLTEELGEVSSAFLKTSGRGRGEVGHEALADEMADLFGFLLLFADWQGIDLETAFRRKWGQYLEASHERHDT